MFSALRSLCWFTTIGFATLVLIGPTMAVVGTLLPFALVGALVWTAFRGARRLVRRLRGETPLDLAPLKVLPQMARGAQQAFQQSLQQCKSLAPAVREHAREVQAKVVKRGRRWGHRLVEAVCGGLTGAVLAWGALGAPDATVGAAALAGAVVGFVISRPSQELVAAK